MECFLNEAGVAAVRFLDAAGKDKLLEAARLLEIPDNEALRSGDFRYPHCTCMMVIDPVRKQMAYIAQPAICAAIVSSGVRIWSAEEFLSTVKLGTLQTARCPVFHVPHDGTEFPEELAESVCIPWERFLALHEKMRDTGVSGFIPTEYRVPHQSVCFPISRLLCDPERFIGEGEIMERYGMGFCYERAYDGTKIKNITPELREKTLRYYHEHHDKVDAVCRMHGRVTVFDLHSFSDEIVPKDFLQPGIPTPDICIGTDEHFTPETLTEIVERHFRDAGFTTARNYPYSGCLVPNSVLSGECGGISVMIECNKRIYCDRSGKPDEKKIAQLRGILKDIVSDCTTL